MPEILYLSPSQGMPQALLDRVLGTIRYGGSAISPALGHRSPLANVRATPLLDPDGLCEIWLADAATKPGRAGPLHFRYSETLLFGCVELDEAEEQPAGHSASRGTPLQQAVTAAYDALLGVADERGYPHLLRLWNYFPAINAESHGLERYRQFNVARQQALLAHRRSATTGAPAACALGTAAGPVTVTFLAARDAPRAIENPRQISAYHYPPEYGPRSPAFSRATLARIGAQQWLFVSGTASIIGHRTAHAGDVAQQTEETLDNIEAVLAQANAAAAPGGFAIDRLALKVYLRDAADLDVVRARVERRARALRPLYLQADICRRDLLVEIEATASLPSAS